MTILITYQYFLPAYKAGGPVQSIKNTARLLATIPGVKIYILCSDSDLDGTKSDVQYDRWVDFQENIKVYYNSASGSKSEILSIIESVEPDVIFINGLYSMSYTIYPLMSKGNARKILSVRGMLHPGALSQKSAKKKIFLTAFKMFGLHKSCEYHATTDEETGYIQSVFGSDKKVWMVPNLPNVQDYLKPLKKESGSVTLMSISLISPMKNILLVLKALKNCKSDISYMIHGPVKDSAYWEECLALIKQMPKNISVQYKGEIEPLKVYEALTEGHYFILPSKSENFGHAIYEALSAGKPVITSHTTPWNGLEEAGAGYNINPEELAPFTALLDDIAGLRSEEYEQATLNAHKYITEQYDLGKINSQYKKMFSV